jgi:hypothetical protein
LADSGLFNGLWRIQIKKIPPLSFDHPLEHGGFPRPRRHLPSFPGLLRRSAPRNDDSATSNFCSTRVAARRKFDFSVVEFKPQVSTLDN